MGSIIIQSTTAPNFLISFSNILAEAINSAKKTVNLQQSIKKRDNLIRQKSALIEQKSLLTAELHHRVRNNLQIIHSMLVSRMSELGTDEELSQMTLRKIASRVMAMAHIYDQLLISGQEEGISVAAYMQALISEIIEIYGLLHPKVVVDKSIDDIELNLDRATVLGLILTELLTNAFTHAFPSGVGTINISLKKIAQSNTAQLTVSDDGIGFEKGKLNKRNGVKLIHMLVQQFEGKIEIETGAGSTFTVTFSL